MVATVLEEAIFRCDAPSSNFDPQHAARTSAKSRLGGGRTKAERDTLFHGEPKMPWIEGQRALRAASSPLLHSDEGLAAALEKLLGTHGLSPQG